MKYANSEAGGSTDLDPWIERFAPSPFKVVFGLEYDLVYHASGKIGFLPHCILGSNRW